MPTLDDNDVRALLLGVWVLVCVILLGVHLDMERAQSVKDRRTVWSSVLANQKAANHKLGVPYLNAEGNRED